LIQAAEQCISRDDPVQKRFWGRNVAGKEDEKPRLNGFLVLAWVYSLNFAKIS